MEMHGNVDLEVSGVDLGWVVRDSVFLVRCGLSGVVFVPVG